MYAYFSSLLILIGILMEVCNSIACLLLEMLYVTNVKSHVTDDDLNQTALDNLPPEVTTDDHDLYKQAREKALQV